MGAATPRNNPASHAFLFSDTDERGRRALPLIAVHSRDPAGSKKKQDEDMAAGSVTLHEDIESLDPKTVDRHRAIVSLMEELEAVDWYAQRAEATGDAALRAILEHNRDEEKEHAAMALEWLRRNDPGMDEQLRTYLFTEGDIHRLEEAEANGGGPEAGGRIDGSLGIGSLREAAKR
jgi:ferritin-like protein